VPFEAPADFAVARYVAIRFCVVPRVRGKTLAAARSSLTKALCKVGTVERRFSANIKRGRVISQRPAPRARLAELARVNLVVSRGRRR
jgi:beta-lactam-binding protein with PASTA domain